MELETTGKPYAVIDTSNKVIDVTMWDGDTKKWQPDEGTICVELDNNDAGIGCTYNSTGSGAGKESTNKWILPNEE